MRRRAWLVRGKSLVAAVALLDALAEVLATGRPARPSPDDGSSCKGWRLESPRGDSAPCRRDSKRRRSANRLRAGDARKRWVEWVRIPADCPVKNTFSNGTPRPWNWRQESEARRRLADGCSTWNPRQCCPIGTARAILSLGREIPHLKAKDIPRWPFASRQEKRRLRIPRDTPVVQAPALADYRVRFAHSLRRAPVPNGTPPVRIGSNAIVVRSAHTRWFLPRLVVNSCLWRPGATRRAHR
jgi:hypothetical protein